MSLYYQDEQVTLHQGDALEVARTLAPKSVDCIVTSPPYFGLRDYGNEGQYGLEESPAAYVETMRRLFAELRRVLADDGTLWLNLGDSYSSGKGGAQGKTGQRSGRTYTAAGLGAKTDLPNKNLIGIPWRVAFALQDDGWILRNSIIWAKPNGMPTSVTDRLATKHENVFLLTKSARYWFDIDPIRRPHSEASIARFATPIKHSHPSADSNGKRGEIEGGHVPKHGVNPGDVWEVPIQPFNGAHFAVMPQELARRAMVAGCKPGGTVLDPFSGSGTTGLVAQNNGRKYVGIDISADYLKLSLETRLQNGTLDLDGAA